MSETRIVYKRYSCKAIGNWMHYYETQWIKTLDSPRELIVIRSCDPDIRKGYVMQSSTLIEDWPDPLFEVNRLVDIRKGIVMHVIHNIGVLTPQFIKL